MPTIGQAKRKLDLPTISLTSFFSLIGGKLQFLCILGRKKCFSFILFLTVLQSGITYIYVAPAPCENFDVIQASALVLAPLSPYLLQYSR
jgi:hypothetical protein